MYEPLGSEARESDVVALVLGGTSVIYSGIGWGDANSKEVNTCGEGYDRNELNFPGVQAELLNLVSGTGEAGGTGHAERPSLYHSREMKRWMPCWKPGIRVKREEMRFPGSCLEKSILPDVCL